MYLDGAALSDEPAGSDGDRQLARRLWRQVRSVFPHVAGTRIGLEQGGGDHLLLIVDEDRVFRFPREGRHDLALEIGVLDRLRPLTAVPVPAYDMVDPDGRFAGYSFIRGAELSPARFLALHADARRTIVADAAGVLAALHGLEPRSIERIDRWRRIWPAGRYADRLALRMPLLRDRLPRLADAVEAFLPRYRSGIPERDAVLHGDLVWEHLLVDDRTDRLAGVIDFGDVALGDPAHDLLGFWAYGADAAAGAVERYDPEGTDPGLLVRSRDHFIRYGIDRLHDSIADAEDEPAIARRAASVEASLADARP